MDGEAVRTLAARVDVVVSGVEADLRALRALRETAWVGPAATVCRTVVDERIVAAGSVMSDLADASRALREHAVAVDQVTAALRAGLAAGADDLFRGGTAALDAVGGAARPRDLVGRW